MKKTRGATPAPEGGASSPSPAPATKITRLKLSFLLVGEAKDLRQEQAGQNNLNAPLLPVGEAAEASGTAAHTPPKLYNGVRSQKG